MATQLEMFDTPAPLPKAKRRRPEEFRPAPFVAGSTTSRQAAQSVQEFTGAMRLRVLAFIASRGAEGATSDEAEHGLGMIHQSSSPRIVELHDGGYITDSGNRRPTVRGRLAIVWLPTELGLAMALDPLPARAARCKAKLVTMGSSRSHRCMLAKGHKGTHRTATGDTWGDP